MTKKLEVETMKKTENYFPFCMLLAGVLYSCAAQASPPQLPELSIDLASIGTNQCQEVAWPLQRGYLQVFICHLPAIAAGTTTAARTIFTVDVPELRRQAMMWRETRVNKELATAIQTMQFTLDALPHRSLHPDWRILINQGVFGCKLRMEIDNDDIRFVDPCNQNLYGADGRTLARGYPDLAIPPYFIEGNRLILGRMPVSLAKPEALPEVTFNVPSSSPAEQLVRAARWGNIRRVSELLDTGTDINSAVEGGSTALLIAVQMRQTEMVEFLLAKGADTNLSYPDGLTALDMARIVKAMELEAMLLKAGSTACRNSPPGQDK